MVLPAFQLGLARESPTVSASAVWSFVVSFLVGVDKGVHVGDRELTHLHRVPIDVA